MLAPRTALLTVAAALLAAALPSAMGHGYIVEPAAVWKQGYPDTGYSATVSGTLWGPIDGSTYGYGGEGAIKYFDANFPTSKFKSLKDLILAEQTVLTEYKADAQCGHTTKDEAKRATLPATLKFTGFTHPGPCEVWCDDNKLAFANDCQTTYADGSIPLDTSKCTGADRLTIYWVAVHGGPWQVYTNCVYLKGGSSSGSGSAPTPAPATTTAPPTVTTAPPTVTTAPPTATTAKPANTTKAPTPTTKTPVAGEASSSPAPKPTTAAPAKNCKRRSRQ